MPRYAHAVLLMGLLLISAKPADAQMMSNFFSVLHRNFVRNNSWPEPFVQPDRASVNMPLDIMTAKGWQRTNLICENHFTEDDTKLNHAGEEQVRWILTSVPAQHRTIFVERGMHSAVTASRIKAVQRTASGVLPRGQFAEIVETNMTSGDYPADVVATVHQKSMQSIPDPKLPKADSGESGGGGGGGGN